MSENNVQILYSTHALQRMFSRSITQEEVENCLIHGVIIADYPNDTPYPSKLLSFTSSIRTIHMVTAYNPEENKHIIITVYIPNPDLWNEDFTSRRKK
jgi:hypothetical protein